MAVLTFLDSEGVLMPKKNVPLFLNITVNTGTANELTSISIEEITVEENVLVTEVNLAKDDAILLAKHILNAYDL